MKLNKPVITTLLIIVLVFTLIFFSFSLLSKKITKKEIISNIIMNFNLKENILENEMINNSISNYKYPEEIFEYIDDNEINREKDRIINRLITNENIIIKESTIENIILNSINIFDKNNKVNSIDYSKNDIKEYSKQLSYLINEELKPIYDALKNVGQDFFLILFFIVFIIISVIIYIFEKDIVLFIDSIILFIYSFFLYYINTNFYKIFSLYDYSKYIKIQLFDLDFTYIICFILGVVLLLIYIIKVVCKRITWKHTYTEVI